MVAARHRLAGVEIAGRWVDVRDPEVLASLEQQTGMWATGLARLAAESRNDPHRVEAHHVPLALDLLQEDFLPTSGHLAFPVAD